MRTNGIKRTRFISESIGVGERWKNGDDGELLQDSHILLDHALLFPIRIGDLHSPGGREDHILIQVTIGIHETDVPDAFASPLGAMEID